MRLLLLTGLFISFLSACARGYVPPPPLPQKTYVGPSYSEAEEERAKKAFEEITAIIPHGRTMEQNIEMMRKVYGKIAESGKPICADVNALHDGCKWLIVEVKENQTVNIYPSGIRNININEGAFSLIDNEDEMAYALSHQMGHLLARHIENQAETSLNTVKTIDFVTRVWAGVFIPGGPFINQTGQRNYPQNPILHENVTADFDSTEDYEADYIAAYLMAKAGYDIEKGSEFLVKAAKNIAATGTDDKKAANYFDIHAFQIFRLAQIYAASTEVKKAQENGKPLMPIGD